MSKFQDDYIYLSIYSKPGCSITLYQCFGSERPKIRKIVPIMQEPGKEIKGIRKPGYKQKLLEIMNDKAACDEVQKEAADLRAKQQQRCHLIKQYRIDAEYESFLNMRPPDTNVCDYKMQRVKERK
jgi:hypothetical protein